MFDTNRVAVALRHLAISPKYCQIIQIPLKGSVFHIVNQATFSQMSYYTTANFGDIVN